MQTVLHPLDYQDFASVFVALLLVTLIGRLMAGDDRRVHTWSNRLAALAMLAHAGLLLVAWRPEGAATVVSIVFRAIITGGFALGMSRIIITVILSIEKLLVRPAVSKCRRDIRSWQDEKQQRQSRREADEASRLKQLEWERRAPERHQAAMKSAATARKNAKAAAEERRLAAGYQKRRQDARAAIEFLYALYKPEIKSRFSQKQFDEFAERDLSDRHSADYVEQRAEQMRLMIQSHLEKGRPAPAKFQTLDDVTKWYEEQQREINGMPDGKMKSVLLARLREKYSDLSFQVLGED